MTKGMLTLTMSLSLMMLVTWMHGAAGFQTSAGFASSTSVDRRTRSFLQSSVSSDNDVAAVQAALDATEKYGATSSQARVLWDVVEELRGADNSAAMLPGMADECLLDEDGINEACMEYDSKMAQLIDLTAQFEDWRELIAEQHMFDQFKELTHELKDLKFQVHESQKTHVDTTSEELKQALTEAIAEAKAATEEHGIHSPFAKLAWETVEEVAASNNQQQAMAIRVLDDECLVDEGYEACLALEQFKEALHNHHYEDEEEHVEEDR